MKPASVADTQLASLSGADNGSPASLRNVVVSFKKGQQEVQSRARGAISRTRSLSLPLDLRSSRSNSSRRVPLDRSRVNQNSWNGNEHVAASAQCASRSSLPRLTSPEEQNNGSGNEQLDLLARDLVDAHVARRWREHLAKNQAPLPAPNQSVTSSDDDEQHMMDILARMCLMASTFSNSPQAYSNRQQQIEFLTLQLKYIEELESAVNNLVVEHALADDDKLSEDGVVEVAEQSEVEQFMQTTAEAQDSKEEVDSLLTTEWLDSAAMRL